ncbi:MAG TPA: ATP-binding protein [Candidatus Binatia bacterium]|nr:ATP-binding protein [Candidatus Binatia bacterium]
MNLARATRFFPLSQASLTARFAVYSFVCIGVMTAALWLVVSNYLISQILDREWQTTAQLVRADVREFLEAYDFQAEDRKSVGHKFAILLEHMRLLPDIERFKVYNPKGVVIWSDDKRLVGKAFLDNEQLRTALTGKVVANISSLEKAENIFEQGGGAVEVYVPIFAENGKDILGVFETYKRADSVYRDVRKARTMVLATTLSGGVLLYLSLFAIVRQAEKKIDEQQSHLLTMQSELVASQRLAAVGEMAAAVAHGIGNPLSSIRAAAQVALLDAHQGGQGSGDKTRENLKSILQQVDRVQRRMQGLLNFAKPLEPHPVSLDVNALLRDVVETLRPRFEHAQVTLSLDLDGTLPKANLDANHLEQVFMGVVTNALEATPRGGQVAIRSQTLAHGSNGKFIHVTIQDTGQGIPPENRERVFEPFFTTKPHGTGIGLPLAKKFVERNGGSISIRDHFGPGAKIEITLPLAI